MTRYYVFMQYHFRKESAASFESISEISSLLSMSFYISCSKSKFEVTPSHAGLVIMKTRLFKYIENLTIKKGKFSDKNFWYFSYS